MIEAGFQDSTVREVRDRDPLIRVDYYFVFILSTSFSYPTSKILPSSSFLVSDYPDKIRLLFF